MKVKIALLLVSAILLCSFSCGPKKSTTRFRIHTTYKVGLTNVPKDDLKVNTDGFCGDCLALGYSGPLSTRLALGATDKHGYRVVEDVYLPATWYLSRYKSSSSQCSASVLSQSVYVYQDKTVDLVCEAQSPWMATPASIDRNAAPSTVTLTGDAVVNTTYGLPSVVVYNQRGAIVGRSQATSASSTGTSVYSSLPSSFLNQPNGSFIFVIANATATGRAAPVAAASVSLTGTKTPIDPPDPCAMSAGNQSLGAVPAAKPAPCD